MLELKLVFTLNANPAPDQVVSGLISSFPSPHTISSGKLCSRNALTKRLDGICVVEGKNKFGTEKVKLAVMMSVPAAVVRVMVLLLRIIP